MRGWRNENTGVSRPGARLVRIKEFISGDLIHTTAEADQMMAELIAARLTETIAALPPKPAVAPP